MYIHGREDVRVDFLPILPGLFLTRVDGMGVPVGPEESLLVQRQSEGVREVSLNHHLPGDTETDTSLVLW